MCKASPKHEAATFYAYKNSVPKLLLFVLVLLFIFFNNNENDLTHLDIKSFPFYS